jgi:hypothetical protein
MHTLDYSVHFSKLRVTLQGLVNRDLVGKLERLLS